MLIDGKALRKRIEEALCDQCTDREACGICYRSQLLYDLDKLIDERQCGVEGFRRSYSLVDKRDLKYCPTCGAKIGVG